MERTLLPSEIRQIGGKLAEDYRSLLNDIESFNNTYFGLYKVLGFANDIDFVIKTMCNKLKGLATAYINNQMALYRDGKITIENQCIAEERYKQLQLTPEQAESRRNKGLTMRFQRQYQIIYSQYVEDHSLNTFPPQYDVNKIERAKEALYLTPDGIKIDTAKFINIYLDFIAADESIAKKMHQNVADTINHFFNGVEITEALFCKYFIFVDGVIKINPKSINLQSYARLGKRS